MATLEKYNYQLKTISKLVLSPREQQAYYLATGDFKPEQVQQKYRGTSPSVAESIKIIYPFYQYGSYTSYLAQDTQYYIPGSSIKGAISSASSQNEIKLMVDDVFVDQETVELHHLYKLQHATDANNKQGKLDIFFPNVAVEMLKAKSTHKGEIFCAENGLETLFEKAQENTVKKLEQFDRHVDSVLNLQLNEDSKQELIDVQKNLATWIEAAKKKDGKSCLLLLGGFKGLMLSRVFGAEVFEQSAEKSAIYVDRENSLPYGLVQITLND